MAEASQPPAEEKSCTICKINSEERVLLCGLHQGEEVWVCVRCLPLLIHGAY